MSEFNAVSKPSHYQLRYPCYEVRDVINERVASTIDLKLLPYASMYDYSNAIKYLLRAPFKHDVIEDLEKAKYCIENMLDILDKGAVSIGSLSKLGDSTLSVDKADGYIPLRLKNKNFHTDTTVPVETEVSEVSEDNVVADFETEEEFLRSVNGNILEIQENSAYCEVFGKVGSGYVLLPIALLPTDCYYGMPITIRMDIQEGIRRFFVEKRPLIDGGRSEELKEFDDLMADF